MNFRESGLRQCRAEFCGAALLFYENHAAVGKPGAIDHIALDTTDVEAAFAAAKEAGLTMLDDEIHGLPFWANGVKFFTVEGPNGEKVEFCQKL